MSRLRGAHGFDNSIHFEGNQVKLRSQLMGVVLAFTATVLLTPSIGMAALFDDGPEAIYRADRAKPQIAIVGLSATTIAQLNEVERLEDVIQVRLVKDGEIQNISLLGKPVFESGELSFVPRFPLAAGQQYRVIVRDPRLLDEALDLGKLNPDESAKGILLVTDLAIAMEQTEVITQVKNVYPSSDEVPENLLKFYVEFSAPMSRGLVYRKSRVVDEQGNPIELAFLEIEEELWNASNDRITLLFDPGRIKRELKPREEIGSPLREGNRYTLIIDGDWKDANGRPLESSFRKDFSVTAHDEGCPDPKHWKVISPKFGSKQALQIQFREPLDRAMLEHAIRVLDANSEAVKGTITIEQNETQWSFSPEKAWGETEYSIEIDTDLEDRAGNSIHKPFEVDLTKTFVSPYPEPTTALKFRSGR